VSDLEYEQMLERERAVANQVNEMLGKQKILSPLEKVTAERDQLRAELEKERERVKELERLMSWFCRRCEMGEVKSRKTYAAFIKALSAGEGGGDD
jgi:hypothetical protein